MTVHRILLAVDGSDGSLTAARWTADLAAALRAEVVVVHALGLLERLEEAPEPDGEQRAHVLERCRDAWCAPLVEAGLAFDVEVRDGPPVAVVLAAAADHEVDLVVLGSRGLGGFPEQLLGSTSTQVAQQSQRPVVIVPTP